MVRVQVGPLRLVQFAEQLVVIVGKRLLGFQHLVLQLQLIDLFLKLNNVQVLFFELVFEQFQLIANLAFIFGQLILLICNTKRRRRKKKLFFNKRKFSFICFVDQQMMDG